MSSNPGLGDVGEGVLPGARGSGVDTPGTAQTPSTQTPASLAPKVIS